MRKAANSVMWKELSWEDLNALSAKDAIVVLPVASMEQHGPHLPVGVDTILCEGVCQAAAELAAKKTPVVVAPTLWCGMAEHHVAFGGTFTFDIPTYRAVLLAFLKSIERAGFRKVAIVNGHGGNMSALNAFLPDFHRETKLKLYFTTYFILADHLLAPFLDKQNGVLHACEVETSMMMVMAAETVKRDRLPDAKGPHFESPREVLAPIWQQFRSLKDYTATGVIGDATSSSEDKGHKCIAACVETLAAKLTDASLWQMDKARAG
jgi:creatinine amidohydrolase